MKRKRNIGRGLKALPVTPEVMFTPDNVIPQRSYQLEGRRPRNDALIGAVFYGIDYIRGGEPPTPGLMSPEQAAALAALWGADPS